MFLALSKNETKVKEDEFALGKDPSQNQILTIMGDKSQQELHPMHSVQQIINASREDDSEGANSFREELKSDICGKRSNQQEESKSRANFISS